MFPWRLELSCTDPCLCRISAAPAPVLPQGTQSGAAGCAPQLLSRHHTFQESDITLCTDVPRSVYEMGSDLCFCQDRKTVLMLERKPKVASVKELL